MSGLRRILFPLAIEPGALVRFKDPDHKQTHVAAERLVRHHGVLSFGPGDKQALHREVSELDGRPRQVWASVIEYLKTCNRIEDKALTTALADFLATAATLPNSADQVRLAIIATDASSSTMGSTGLTSTERVTLPNIDESSAVAEASSIGVFPVDTTRTQIAQQLLHPLASRSTCVRIMDPQILETYLRDPTRRPAHLEWLLNVLADSLRPHATVSIIGTLQNQWRASNRTRDEESIKALLGSVLQSRRAPLTVKVQLVQALRQPLKNRYLWFDCTEPFDVLHNFYPLGTDPLKEEFRITRQTDDAATMETKRLAGAYEGANIRATVDVSFLAGHTSAR